jgi:hypothetical protein
MRMADLVAMLLVATVAAQEPTCRLEGQVVDPLQQPVANAEVTASVDGEVLARTHSDGSGLFVFGRLPYRVVVVQARAAGPDIGAGWFDLLGLPRQFVRIPTMPARAVTGVVQNEDEEPVAGAWIVSAPSWPNGPNDATPLATSMVRANARGEFTLTHVPFGHNLLRAWAPEHEVGEDAVDGCKPSAVRLQVVRRARQERAFALDAGPEQLAAARLQVTVSLGGYPLPLPPPLRHPALVDGVWHVLGWPVADAMAARLLLDGADIVPRAHFVAADRSGGVHRFALAGNDANARLRGKLVGPAARAGLWLVAAPLLAAPGQERVLGCTTGDGVFDLPAPVDVGQVFQLSVLAADVATVRQAPQAARGWWQGLLATSCRCEVAVAAARQVHLRVVRGDGTPVMGAAVTLHRDVPQREGVWILPSGGDDNGAGPIAGGTTGTDGRLALTGLDLDDGDALECRVQSAEGWLAIPLPARPQSQTDFGDVTLLPGATLSVTAVDPAGQRVPGARITLSPAADGPDLWLRCNRDGRLLLTGLRPAHYIVVGTFQDPAVVILENDSTTEVTVTDTSGN